MVDFNVSQKTAETYPKLRKILTLKEGERISDDAEVLEFAQRKVPIGKTAKVLVNITIVSLKEK